MRKIEKINLLKAVSSVCVSREIFQKLKNQGIGRALLHLVFLAFLCSCFIILAGNDYLLKKIENSDIICPSPHERQAKF